MTALRIIEIVMPFAVGFYCGGLYLAWRISIGKITVEVKKRKDSPQMWV